MNSKALATLIPLIVAVAIFVGLTAGFFLLSYQYMAGSLEAEMQMCADLLEDSIRLNPGGWRNDPRTGHLLQVGSIPGETHDRRLLDLADNIIKEHTDLPSPPLMTRFRDLSDGTATVARLQISRSIRQLIHRTWLAALVSLLLSFLIFILLRTIPLRAVRRAENSLLQSEYRYRTLFQESKDAIIISGPDGAILEANAAAVSLFGYDSREAMASVRVTDILSGDQGLLGKLSAMLEGDGELRNHEFTCITRDGRRISGVLTAVEVLDRRQEGRSINIFCRDQTAQKMIEQQLLHSQKMEAVGVLAGGVAHDFNSILTIISGFAEIMQKRVEKGDQLREYVEGMLAATKRAAHLVKGLLAFSRNDRIALQPVPICRMIRDSGKLLSILLGEGVQLSLPEGEGELTVMADRELLHQVLMNLVTNARDAMPHGGELTISVAPSRIDEPFIAAHGFGIPGEYAAITVRDTGEGMPEEVIKKIFEPFFTTKEVGRGTGLGLSIVYGIVKQHNGFVLVQSERGRGTEFIIYLPLPGDRKESG